MSKVEQILNGLNPGQRRAVETLQGPVLVVAGPGTGKTQVLATRIANILQSTDTQASNILCLTFTESGVVAMRNRLLKIIGSEAYYVRIHTFHGFAAEIIQSFPEKFAFSRELSQLSDLERIKIVAEIIDNLSSDTDYELRPFYNPYAYQSDILNGIKDLKRENVSVEDFTKLATDSLSALEQSPEVNSKTGKPTTKWSSELKIAKRNVELAELYAKYQEALEVRGMYDYEDMILFVIREFQKDEELLAHYQERYLYILVDEYQDTNGAQNEIVRLLGSFDPAPNIFAVGDDDQAIYRFQGASVENLLSFNKMFKDVVTIPITSNYRSSQTILDGAASVIEHNADRLTNLIPDLTKDLTAALDIKKEKIQVYEFTSSQVETKFIAQKLQQLQAAGEDLSEVAVLYRRHSDAEDIIDALQHNSIPMRLVAGSDILENNAVRKILNLLRVIQYEGEGRDLLLLEVLFYDFLSLPRVDVFKLIRFAGDNKLNIFDLLLDAAKLQEAKIENPEVFTSFAAKLIDWRTLDANLPLSEFAEKVMSGSGYLRRVFGDDQNQADVEDINAVNSLFEFIKLTNRLDRDVKLVKFLEDINLLKDNRLSISAQELDINMQGVQLMTAHAAKGLEFKHVFIIKCYDGNWGGRRTRQIIKLPQDIYTSTDTSELVQKSDLDNEDERRLFYVAMTRAKEHLYITMAKTYPSGNDTKEVSPSQFVGELDSELTVKPDVSEFEEFDPDYSEALITGIAELNYSEAEREFLSSLVKDFKLSASALNEYIECPLKFKFNRLLRIPKPQDRILALGTAVHYVLEHYHRQLMAGVRKDLDYVQFLFKKSVEKELISEEEKSLLITEGNKLLTDYFEHYEFNFETPAEVEYGFYGRQVVLENKEQRTENKDSDIANEPILLTGKIDKITWLDKDNSLVKVTDYKTSSPKSQNEIKGLTKSSEGNIYRQLVFYKLLSELDDRFRPAPGKPKYKIAQVEVDFIKPNSTGKFKRELFEISDQDVKDLKEEIYEVMSKIRNLEFGGSEDHPLCGGCEYCQMLSTAN